MKRNFIYLLLLMHLPFFTLQVVKGQYNSPELVLEVPPEIAKYYIQDNGELIGPASCIDIDENGDIYLGGGAQVLVFNKNGEHLRSMMFFRSFTKSIEDIALGTNDKLYILASSKNVYIINKNIEPKPVKEDTLKVVGNKRIHRIKLYKDILELYPEDKKLVEITRDKVIKRIYLRSGTAFRRIMGNR